MHPIIPQSDPSVSKSELPEKLGRRNLFKRDNYFSDSTEFNGGSQKRSGIKLALWSIMASFIDSLIMISISCFTIIFFSVLLRIRMFEALRYVLSDKNIAEIFLVTFFFSFWIYLIVMRVFMNATLGEWTCQLRLGQPTDRIQTSYALRVIIRTSLIFATGILPLPLLSWFYKKDLVGDITGMRLYSLL